MVDAGDAIERSDARHDLTVRDELRGVAEHFLDAHFQQERVDRRAEPIHRQAGCDVCLRAGASVQVSRRTNDTPAHPGHAAAHEAGMAWLPWEQDLPAAQYNPDGRPGWQQRMRRSLQAVARRVCSRGRAKRRPALRRKARLPRLCRQAQARDRRSTAVYSSASVSRWKCRWPGTLAFGERGGWCGGGEGGDGKRRTQPSRKR